MSTLDYNHDAPDPSTVPLIPSGLRYGLIGGLVLIVYSMVMNLIGMGAGTGNDMINSLSAFVLVGGIVYYALTKHRDNDLGGYITYGRSIGLGVLTCLVMGVLAGIFAYIYMSFIDPGILEQIAEKARDQYEEMGMDEDQIDAAMSYVETFSSPGMIAVMSVISYGIMGLIASLIVGAIVKKNPPEVY
jgi:hypothetical protein